MPFPLDNTFSFHFSNWNTLPDLVSYSLFSYSLWLWKYLSQGFLPRTPKFPSFKSVVSGGRSGEIVWVYQKVKIYKTNYKINNSWGSLYSMVSIANDIL